MRIINAQNDKLSAEHLNDIKTTLDNDGIILFPTETVYGLMCRYGNEKAKKRIFETKKRSPQKQLQCLVHSHKVIEQFDVDVSPLAKKILQKFSPGPLTVILENKLGETFGFRIPDFPLLQKVLTQIEYPLWATSANISGQNDQLKFAEIIKIIPSSIDLAIKNDNFLNQASTVVKIKENNFQIIREGIVSAQQLQNIKLQLIEK